MGYMFGTTMRQDMFVWSWLGLFHVAFGEEFFLSISQPVEPGIGATWSFPLYIDSRWMLASGQGGDLTIAPLSEDGSVNMVEVMTVTDVGEIRDHALRKCPNEQFLYAGSTGVEDDILVYRFDPDFLEIGYDVLPQSVPLHAGNDMAAICSPSFSGIGVAELQGLRDYYWHSDPEGVLEPPIELAQSPRMTGAGMWEEDGKLHVVGRDAKPELSLSVYDTELLLLEQHLIPPIDASIVNYWSSSVLTFDHHILLLSMGRNPDDNWPLDTGNVYLAVLGKDFSVQEWIQLTDFLPSSGGGMRPWMERFEDQLWVSYDRGNQIELISITLNLDVFEPDAEEQLGESSTEPTTESNNNDSLVSVSKEGGCAGFMGIPLLLLFRKKRKSSPCLVR